MTLQLDPVVFLFLAVIGAVFIAACLLFCFVIYRKIVLRRRRRARRLIGEIIDPEISRRTRIKISGRFIKKRIWIFLEELARIGDTIAFTDEQRTALQNILKRNRIDIRLIRDLHARDSYLRSRAAVYLSFLPTRGVRASLLKALEIETSHPARLSLTACCAKIGESSAIPTIIDTLKGSPPRYQEAVWGIIREFGETLEDFIPMFIRRKEKEIQLLLIHLSYSCCPGLLRDYVEALADSNDLDIAHAAFRVLSSTYISSLDHRRYLKHDDFLIRNLAAESLGTLPATASLALLFDHLDDPVIRKSAVLALTALVRARPQYLKIIMYRCLNEQRSIARLALTDVLANFVDYLMEKLLSPDADMAEQIIFELVQAGKSSEIINFLNRNSNTAIEQKVLAIVKELLEKKTKLSAEFLAYLNNRVLRELGLESKKTETQRPRRREHPNRRLLLFYLFLGVALIPLICFLAALYNPAGFQFDSLELFLHRFILYFNVVFSIYATSISLIYLVLLLFSIRGVRRQSRIGAIVRNSLLFKERVLPSISVISPAYNEEASIVESVNSLLNLRYPDYEIIVVNDGSSDRTLQRLISYFELERTDVFIHKYLNTQEIRGVYANKKYPELLVIDKVNGGKADSLNAGINVCRKEYFSGIDADSLLEENALLNLAGLFLYAEEQVVAAGGNIFPVNGCTVEKGMIVKTRIPKRKLACFQTIEYLRAFMAGRVGWATLKLLLIISGAFGVFHRRSVINAYGYLTQSEHYLKDTVGEDMELVVRLSRGLREGGRPFSIVYCYNANCWTQIPERMKILVSQRDRWQRGLLDIITFHKKMLFNPSYGRIGVIGLPYFLLYEVLGPWFEIEGFIVFIASLVFGLIGLPLLCLVLTATVGLNLLVSVLSLSIAEYRKDYFPIRDKLRLIFYAILENFGIRQFFGFIRARALVRMLFKLQGWGKMERRGFSAPGKK
jgi:cellulose synthase/poly-beta-1,6-N-acetylglucosamine synthase-like glycosyltransferase/HEAT repeat protein